MTTPVERLLAMLPDAKKNGNGWAAHCPAHDDRRASLSISQGDNGGAVLHCHAGCDPAAVVAAVGLTLADLMPVNSVNVNKTPSNTGKTDVSLTLTTRSKPTGKPHATANEVVAELERRHGPRSAMWTYHDARGQPVGVVVRWDRAEGRKDIRPVSRYDDGWRIGGMQAPRPLYGLPELGGTHRVFVCEGEKAADAVRSIGLVATTSAHGCESPGKTDWQPLAGKEVTILPDDDEPGRKYAETVLSILAKLTPAPGIKVVVLPDLPDHGDAADFVATHAGTDLDQLRQLVERLADDAQPIQTERPTPCVHRFDPFPMDALPEPMRGFAAAGAKAIGCDPSYLVLPLLCGMAGAVGATRRIAVSETWHEPLVLWGAIIGESGTQKTPAQEAALRPLESMQAWHLEQLPERLRQYEREKLLFEADKKIWSSKGRSKGEPPPEPPEEPKAPRHIVGDQTIEALADRLHDNPRGLLVVNDELSSWLGGMDRYRGGHGRGEVGQWLLMHRAGRVLIDRKTGAKKTVFIARAAVSIVGGITPGAFGRAIGPDGMENGLAARLLVAMPPRRAKRWSNSTIPATVANGIERLYSRLLALEFTTDQNDSPAPVDLPLESDAKAAFQRFVNEHGEEQLQHTGHLASVWSKIEAAAARFALLFALVRWADGDGASDAPEPVTLDDVQAGITVARWFAGEWVRLSGTFHESDEARDQRRLVEWIERKGGSVTVREVQSRYRPLRQPGAAEPVLEALVKAGYGRWQDVPPGPRGGRPSRVFRLSTLSTSTQPAETRDSEGFVDVDTVDAPDDEWGEI